MWVFSWEVPESVQLGWKHQTSKLQSAREVSICDFSSSKCARAVGESMFVTNLLGAWTFEASCNQAVS